ncbi:MAG: AraC family transcriptional regulator [Proteobacteria bacterium]|nr:MAG: AraC family transcriptional regulator [Pseudomonadota bacterium]
MTSHFRGIDNFFAFALNKPQSVAIYFFNRLIFASYIFIRFYVSYFGYFEASRIKAIIIEYVRGNEELRARKLSVLISERAGRDYAYLSTLFSAVEGISIEQYAILQRVELVKELISYREQSLTEIAFELGYSSVAHLSQQFKKVTGLTPSQFRQSSEAGRKPLDEIGR